MLSPVQKWICPSEVRCRSFFSIVIVIIFKNVWTAMFTNAHIFFCSLPSQPCAMRWLGTLLVWLKTLTLHSQSLWPTCQRFTICYKQSSSWCPLPLAPLHWNPPWQDEALKPTDILRQLPLGLRGLSEHLDAHRSTAGSDLHLQSSQRTCTLNLTSACCMPAKL